MTERVIVCMYTGNVHNMSTNCDPTAPPFVKPLGVLAGKQFLLKAGIEAMEMVQIDVIFIQLFIGKNHNYYKLFCWCLYCWLCQLWCSLTPVVLTPLLLMAQ